MLTEQQEAIILTWKRRGTIRNIKLDTEIKEISSAVFCGCSDDLIDACCHVRKSALGVNPVRHFGVPFIFAPSFRRFRENFAWEMLDLMSEGMAHKGTDTILLCPHAPCGMMGKYEHDFIEIPALTQDAMEYIFRNLPGVKIVSHLHLRRKGQNGGEKQVTYDFLR